MLVRKFRRMAAQSKRTITTPSLERGADMFINLVRRPNWGFFDRTHRLRQSVKVERLREDGKLVGVSVIAGDSIANARGEEYAGFVERKPRTVDSRPGPPYWFGRAWRIVRRRVTRLVNKEVEKRVAKQGRRR